MGQNPTKEDRVEPQVFKNSMDELPIKSVVCFQEIELDGHESRFELPSFKTMQKLMHNNLVFSNPSAWYKGRLTRRDGLVEERS